MSNNTTDWKALAAILGAKLSIPKEMYCGDSQGTFTFPDGLKIWVCDVGRSMKRIWEFSHTRPRAGDGTYIDVCNEGHKVCAPSINVSPERELAAIARDIERRLLPDAQADLALAREAVAEHDAYTSAKSKVRKAMKAEGATFHDDSDSGYHPHCSSLRINSDTVTLELYSVNVPTARKILRLLSKIGK